MLWLVKNRCGPTASSAMASGTNCGPRIHRRLGVLPRPVWLHFETRQRNVHFQIASDLVTVMVSCGLSFHSSMNSALLCWFYSRKRYLRCSINRTTDNCQKKREALPARTSDINPSLLILSQSQKAYLYKDQLLY